MASFASDRSSDTLSDHSFQSPYSTPPPTPTKRRRRPPVFGADPSGLIGKVLTTVRKSPSHPTLTLEFADHSTYRILVDGYNPHPDFQGIPKVLEMDAASGLIFNPPNGHLATDLTIRDCAMINLSDRAFDNSQQWDQIHQGIAFKFCEQTSWHCIWATMAENDRTTGSCIFRSYVDVYLEDTQRLPQHSAQNSPRKNRNRKRSSAAGTWK